MSLLIQPKTQDDRWEQARSLAAEQQALRLQREQTAHIQPSVQAPAPAEAQRLATAGIVGSKRLAENLEGMLRDKPKHHFFQPEAKASQKQPEALPDSPRSEPASFVPSEPPLELPLFDRRPRRAAEDPHSQDLNLSPQSRQAALTQGMPSSQTIRAAAALFAHFS
ncbi:MAG: hypothetical protein KF760_19015 [Candidatus Eremiobacteraeota bacterium]|nr:hypothetical protein [Candidatus Eremiobacteraeota bacterium]MCW5870290.1 hypothetical protein [Candidatus Eremiobacteraeota bacterium]